jgi:hypothetical protein
MFLLICFFLYDLDSGEPFEDDHILECPCLLVPLYDPGRVDPVEADLPVDDSL